VARKSGLGFASKVVDETEGAVRSRATADRNQVGVAEQVLHGIDRHRAVVGKGLEQHLAEEALPLHPERVGQQIGVGDQHGIDGAFLQPVLVGRIRPGRAGGSRKP
jgi:hypothetical protein